ncbi:MAG: hypothetical protein ACRC6T_03185 [Sarcina sp.]
MSLQKDKKESVKLDQILKYLFNTSNKVLVKLLNGLFDESFDEDEVEITVSNNEYIEESLDVLRGDMFYNALDSKGKKVGYHIEFQTKNDSTMVVRTFEYGFRKARDEARVTDGIKTLYFPKQKVIFFEENSGIENNLKLRIIFPDNSEHIYEAGVMKYWEYSKEEIIEKKMYPLIPLQLFNFRKELKKLEAKNDLERIKNYAKEAKILAKNLANISNELLYDNEIYGEDFHKMLLGIQNLIEYLNRVYFKDEDIEEEVESMTKTLYDFEVEKRGIEKGELKGKIEAIKAILDVFSDEEIAKRLKVDVELVEKIRKDS